MNNLKKSEISGYHAFARKSGWNNSYEGFLQRARDGGKSGAFFAVLLPTAVIVGV